jgi:hypothetical protein
LETITVTPAAGTQVMTQAGQTVQFHATATYTKGTHPVTTRDVTNEVQWASSNPAVATIDASGKATAAGAGTTDISASMNGNFGVVSGSSDVKVEYSADPHQLTSIAIIPATGIQTVTTLGETAQFIAIGTFNSAPTTQDVTSQVTWKSSDVLVATINPAGLATAVNNGKTTLTAIYTNLPGGVTITGGSDLTVNLNGGGGVKLPSITIYSVGLGAGSVTSDPPGINCSATNPAGCTANFPVNKSVVLTATGDDNSLVNGWSSNCTPINPPIIPPPVPVSSCGISVTAINDTIGVIFVKK